MNLNTQYGKNLKEDVGSRYSHISRRMETFTVNGSIILMHIYGTYTLDVLEKYIPSMQAEGYRFVTVSQLLSSGKILDQLGNVYDPIVHDN